MNREPAETVVAADGADLADRAAALLLSLIRDALERRGRARIVLSGGTTPRAAYGRLASSLRAARVDPGRLLWYFGDERWVPREDPLSNEGMARSELLDPVGAPEETIRSWLAGQGDPVDSARRYDGILPDERPDVVLLGIGSDGHTASLFPGASAHLPDGRRLRVTPGEPWDFLRPAAAAVEPEGNRGWRLTLCPGYLSTARHVVFLAAGIEKTASLAAARRGDPAVPASWIRGERTVFLATRDAAEPAPRVAPRPAAD